MHHTSICKQNEAIFSDEFNLNKKLFQIGHILLKDSDNIIVPFCIQPIFCLDIILVSVDIKSAVIQLCPKS